MEIILCGIILLVFEGNKCFLETASSVLASSILLQNPGLYYQKNSQNIKKSAVLGYPIQAT